MDNKDISKMMPERQGPSAGCSLREVLMKRCYILRIRIWVLGVNKVDKGVLHMADGD